MKLKIKICGMKHAANIAAVAELQPDYMGFIFYRKSPRFISDISSELIKYLPDPIKATGVFVDETLGNVNESILRYRLKSVQLHGEETPIYCEALKQTGTEIIKAFGIHPDFDFSKLEAYMDNVDIFLFDTQTAAHGGSGMVFDWRLLNQYHLAKPFFLSGGIDIAHAESLKNIDHPWFYGIDLNSRFEVEPGHKDVEKLKEFMTILSV